MKRDKRFRNGSDSPSWKGGKTIGQNGYSYIYAPTHPKSHNNYVLEHVLIAEKAIRKFLPDGAEVHHVNENPLDNNNSNLVICQDHAYHFLLHKRMRAFLATGNPNERKCSICKEWGADYRSDKWSYHRRCKNEVDKKRRAIAG